MMTGEAQKRITALEQFSELGSGFNIAMKIWKFVVRAILWSGEQSGFINEIGFDTYQKIMNEAIDELKETNSKTYTKKKTTSKNQRICQRYSN